MKIRIFLSFLLIVCGKMLFALSDTTITLPEVNAKIIEYCNGEVGNKVGRGECWDLAKYALNHSNAKWAPPFSFGKKLKSGEEVLPGDIIQFANVKIVNKDKSTTAMSQHTAVIHSVLGPKHYMLCEQNVNRKRFVVISEIDLNNMVKGKFDIYRPEKK